MKKRSVREKVLASRESLTSSEHKELSQSIMDNIINSSFYKDSDTIMVFVSFSDEVDTHEFIKRAIKDGKNIAVPVTFKENRLMKPSIIKDFNELEEGAYNILEPKKEFIRYIDKSEIDLVLTPTVAFDKKGYRVGYGGGYYDRFFTDFDGLKVGVAFDIQLVDYDLPVDDYDIPVDYIITEKESIDCIKNR